MKKILKSTILYLFGILLLFLFISFKNNKEYQNSGKWNVEPTPQEIFQNKRIIDGPYIFYENYNTIVRWIYKNRVSERVVPLNGTWLINRKFGLNFKHNWLDYPINQTNYEQTYKNIENIAVISDVHGQFDLFIKLLRNNNIIDDELNWVFGKGQLVILGDIFDRGPKVTEALWLAFRLEKQAELSGGKVHFLLGNHELMVLNNDLRYINEKYHETSKLMNKTYSELFAENTFLGNWLRTKPAIIKINDLLFVHAGISPEFIKKGYSISETNKLFVENITGKSWKEILENEDLNFLMGSNGPIWYRGYFKDEKFPENSIDIMLKHFDVNHIIIGHTTLPNITSMFNNKVLGVDSGIKDADYGEILLIKKNSFFRCTPTGTIITL